MNGSELPCTSINLRYDYIQLCFVTFLLQTERNGRLNTEVLGNADL